MNLVKIVNIPLDRSVSFIRN